MTRRLLAVVPAIATLLYLTVWSIPVGAAPLPLAQSSGVSTLPDTVVLTIDPMESDVILGENMDLVVSVTNTGVDETPPLVIHIDITKTDQATSVDPEDWTPTLSKPVGPVQPGRTVTVDWNIQPISSGTFATYAVALAPGLDTVAPSNVLEVRVADQRSLNPGGILPVALAAPAAVGALLLIQLRSARRAGSTSGRR